MGEIFHFMKASGESQELPLEPAVLAELLNFIDKEIITQNIAKNVFKEMIECNKSASAVIKEKNLVQILNHDQIDRIISKVIEKNPVVVSKYLSGDKNVFGYFVGQVMKETRGKANPKLVNKLLLDRLSSL
jgi:aspartyl-tRNA(Asn)/glutamyl-tRNA(Gln) amidotransferase subunit B